MSNSLGFKPNWSLRNLANAITGFGIALSLFLLWVVIFHREQTGKILLLVVGIILTDFLDGIVARCFEAASKFGGALDRFRDKLFQFTMFFFFLLDPRVDPWLKGVLCPLIIVEILLLAILFLGVKRRIDVSSSIWGKVKMFLMSLGIIACPAGILAKENGMKVPLYATDILFMIFIVSVFFAVMSLKNHVAKYRQQLKLHHQQS